MDLGRQNITTTATAKALKRMSRLFSNTKLFSASKPYSSLDEDFIGDPPPISFAPDSTRLPALPTEIWDHILAYVTRLSGKLNISLPDAFHVGVHDQITKKMERESRRNAGALQLVCRAWRVAAIKLTYEHITLCCHEHMQPLIAVLERTKARDPQSRGYGWWVKEIECRNGICPSSAGEDIEKKRVELEIYHAAVVRALQCTPNLMIYTNSNGWGGPLGFATHADVLVALGKHCGRSLKKLEWIASESPRFVELQTLLYETPYLRSLSVLHTFYPKQPVELLHEKPCFLRYLRELRLGPFPTPHGAPVPVWDKFLTFLTPAEQPAPAPYCLPPEPTEEELQLPQIRSLSITPVNILKLHTPTERFLTIYGPRLRFLRTSNLTPKAVLSLSESVAVRENRSLRTMLALCPHLRDLIFNPLQPTQFPLAHPTLERIGIFPPHENAINAPKRMYDQVIQAPVDRLMQELLAGGFPNLKVVRLRDAGSFGFLGRSDEWLDNWQPKMEERGIRFENRDGMKLDLYNMDCMEDIPDGV